MNRFELAQAQSLAEAVAFLGTPGARAKAGGIDLLDRMKEGLEAPTRLVNLRTIAGLDYVRDGADGLRLGPLVTLAHLSDDAAVRARYPALAAAAAHAATPQLRNMATLGGNLAQRPRCWYFRAQEFVCRKKGGSACFAIASEPIGAAGAAPVAGESQYHAIFGNQRCAMVHPSTLATALAAYEARLRLVSPRGERELGLADFFTTPERDVTRENVLAADELIAEVHLPPPAPGTRAAYRKQGEKESFDWPLADVAVVLELQGRLCQRAVVVLGAAAPVPYRARAAETVLTARVIDEAAARAAAEAALADATPLARNGYKVAVFAAVVRRTILAAAGGAT